MKKVLFAFLLIITLSSCNRANSNKLLSKVDQSNAYTTAINVDQSNTSTTATNAEQNAKQPIIWQLYPVSSLTGNNDISLTSGNSIIDINLPQKRSIETKQAVLYCDGQYNPMTIIASWVDIQQLVQEYITDETSESTNLIKDKHFTVNLSEEQARLVSLNNIGIKVKNSDTSTCSPYLFYYLFRYSDQYIMQNSSNSDEENYLRDIQCLERTLLLKYKDNFYLYDLNTLAPALEQYYSKTKKCTIDPNGYIYSLRNIQLFEKDANIFIKLTYEDVYTYCYSLQHGTDSSYKASIFKVNDSDMSIKLIIDYMTEYWGDSYLDERIANDDSIIEDVMSATKNINIKMLNFDSNENESGHGTEYKYSFDGDKYSIDSYSDFTYDIDPILNKHDER